MSSQTILMIASTGTRHARCHVCLMACYVVGAVTVRETDGPALPLDPVLLELTPLPSTPTMVKV